MMHLLDQLTKLAESSKKLGNITDLDELYETIFDLVTDIFDNSTAAILLRNPKDGTLSIVASRGYDPDVVKTFRAGSGQGVTGTVLATGEPQLVAETVGDPRYIQGVPEAESEMAVPLHAGSEVIGVLDMESTEHRFSDADLTMFVTFGEQVVTSIRNLKLQSDLEERARRLVAIAKVGQSLTREHDLQRLLDRILEAVSETLRLDACALQLWDDTGDHLVVIAARGYDQDVMGLKVPRGAGVTGRVAELKEPAVIGDVTEVPYYIPGLSECLSELAVPLVLHDEVIGVLNVESREPQRFDETDLLHATIFADQAAAAIDNARVAENVRRIEQEVSQLSGRLQLIASTASKMSSIGDLDALLDQILDLARTALGYERIAVLLPDPSGLQLEVVRAAGYVPETEGRMVPVEASISGAAYSSGESVLVPDVKQDPRYITGVENARSNLAVPLKVEDDVVGVLNAETAGDEELGQTDVEVLQMLAAQVASAVRSARQQSDLKERSRRLAMIHKAACAINAIDDPEEMLETILQFSQKALGLEAVAILIPDEERQQLIVRKAIAHGEVEGLEIPIGKGFTGSMFITGKAGIIDDIEAHPEYIPGTPGARSEMAVPLSLEGETIAVLEAESLRPHAFSAADLEMFRIFGSQVATALKNAELIKDLAERAHRLTMIHRAACSLNAIDDPEELLDTILQLARKAIGLEAVAILIPDAERQHLVVRKAIAHGEVEGLEIPIGKGFTGSMFITGQAGIIDDITQEPGYIDGTPGARCEMAVPLSLEGETIGILDAESLQPNAFNELDLEMFRVFGSQVATALKNAELISTLDTRARRLTMIHRAACSLNAIDDPEEMLETILKLAQKALDLDSVAILTPDGDPEYLTVRKAIAHGDVEGLKIKIGSGFTGAMYVTGKAAIIDDVAEHPDYITGTPGARSEMAVPLSLEGETIGILDAESMEPHAFNEEHLAMFRVFASQVATALHNARMISDLRSRSRRLQMLNKAAHALSSLHDPAELLEEILSSSCQALDLSRAAILLVDPDDGDLILHSAIGYGDVLGMRVPAGKGITGHVATRKRPVLISNTAEDERYIDGFAGGACEMAAPMLIQDEVIGVLDTEHPEVGRFSEGDLELFSAFAAQAAVAIHNARLITGLEEANLQLAENITEMKRLNRELESYAAQIAEANTSLEWQIDQLTTLHEAGRTITSSLDLDTTLKTILDMSSKIIGSTAGAIKLIDEESKELRIRAEAGKLGEGSRPRSVLDLPLRIGEKTIGVFELVREAKEALDDDERQLLETMASQAAIAIENARLFENTQRVYYETLRSLASALEARDDYTRGHSERVAEMSKNIAEILELPERDVKKIHNAALLHDIGKIGIRDEVLLAPRKLTAEEMEAIQKHPSFGNTILLPLKFLGEIREYVRYHHERWDGSGYPDGRSGEQIPLASRIIAVADTFDAMTSNRPYRAALARDTAIEEIRSSAGTQFDPQVVDAFVSIVNA
jgi:GAF domain-containing protein